MSRRDRWIRVRALTANVAVAVGALVVIPATAGADPGPPGPEVPVNSIGTPLAQNGQPPGPGGLPLGVYAGADTAPPSDGLDFLLSQHQTPALNGTLPAAPPDMNGLGASADLLPQNFKLADQGLDTMYSVAPRNMDAQNPGLIDYLKGVHGLWHLGMGRLEQDQLGQPLPGTAPPPGTNIPAGPEQFLPDPPAPPDIP